MMDAIDTRCTAIPPSSFCASTERNCVHGVVAATVLDEHADDAVSATTATRHHSDLLLIRAPWIRNPWPSQWLPQSRRARAHRPCGAAVSPMSFLRHDTRYFVCCAVS